MKINILTIYGIPSRFAQYPNHTLRYCQKPLNFNQKHLFQTATPRALSSPKLSIKCQLSNGKLFSLFRRTRQSSEMAWLQSVPQPRKPCSPPNSNMLWIVVTRDPRPFYIYIYRRVWCDARWKAGQTKGWCVAEVVCSRIGHCRCVQFVYVCVCRRYDGYMQSALVEKDTIISDRCDATWVDMFHVEGHICIICDEWKYCRENVRSVCRRTYLWILPPFNGVELLYRLAAAGANP